MVDGGEPGVISRDEGKHTGRNDLLFVKKMMWMDERVRRQTNKQNLSGQNKKNQKMPEVSIQPLSAFSRALVHSVTNTPFPGSAGVREHCSSVHACCEQGLRDLPTVSRCDDEPDDATMFRTNAQRDGPGYLRLRQPWMVQTGWSTRGMEPRREPCRYWVLLGVHGPGHTASRQWRRQR